MLTGSAVEAQLKGSTGKLRELLKNTTGNPPVIVDGVQTSRRLSERELLDKTLADYRAAIADGKSSTDFFQRLR